MEKAFKILALVGAAANAVKLQQEDLPTEEITKLFNDIQNQGTAATGEGVDAGNCASCGSGCVEWCECP